MINWDEFDSSKHKTNSGLALQFLRLLKNTFISEKLTCVQQETNKHKKQKKAIKSSFVLEIPHDFI